MADEFKKATSYAKRMKLKLRNDSEALAYHKLYDQLGGMTIAAFYCEQDEYDPENLWPTFVIHRKEDNKYAEQTLKLVLSCDPEGNGGGFAFIEPVA